MRTCSADLIMVIDGRGLVKIDPGNMASGFVLRNTAKPRCVLFLGSDVLCNVCQHLSFLCTTHNTTQSYMDVNSGPNIHTRYCQTQSTRLQELSDVVSQPRLTRRAIGCVY